MAAMRAIGKKCLPAHRQLPGTQEGWLEEHMLSWACKKSAPAKINYVAQHSHRRAARTKLSMMLPQATMPG